MKMVVSVFVNQRICEFADETNSYNIIDEIYQECANTTQWKPHVHNNCINRLIQSLRKINKLRSKWVKKIKLTLKTNKYRNEDYLHRQKRIV